MTGKLIQGSFGGRDGRRGTRVKKVVVRFVGSVKDRCRVAGSRVEGALSLPGGPTVIGEGSGRQDGALEGDIDGSDVTYQWRRGNCAV